MTRPRHLLALFVAAAVAVVIVPACTVVDPPAITVGTWSMSRKDFLAKMQELTDKGTFEAEGAPKPAAGGTTTVPTNYKTSDTASVLNIYAQSQILQQELVRRNIKVTPDDQSAFLQAMVQRASAQGQQTTVQQLEQQLQTLDELIRMQVDTQIAQQALGRALVPEAEAETKARADYDANKEKLAKTCLSFIHAGAGTPPSRANPQPPTPTEADYQAALAKAQAAKAKVDSGTPFADVAKSDSDEPETAAKGGEVGCLTGQQLQQLPPDVIQLVTTLPVNTASQPARIDGDGYYVFDVTSRQTPEFQEVQADLVARARQELASTRTEDAIQEARRNVPVTVDPLFGQWDVVKFEVVPPAGAEQPSTTVPSTDTGLFPGGPAGPGGIVPEGPAGAQTQAPPSTAGASTTSPASSAATGSAGSSGSAGPSGSTPSTSTTGTAGTASPSSTAGGAAPSTTASPASTAPASTTTASR